MDKKQHVIDIIFALSLFCVFAVMSLLVVVLGANVYKKISGDMEDGYNVRGSLAYITEKVRQNDVREGMAVKEVDGQDALVLGNGQYETWIFVNDGRLLEATVEAGTQVTPAYGQTIMELNELRLEKAGSLLRIGITDRDGNISESAVCAKSTIQGEGQSDG